MTTLNTIPAEESTLLQKKPQASLKFQAHLGAANASTKAKKIVGAVAAAALVLGVLAATAVSTGVAPTRTNSSERANGRPRNGRGCELPPCSSADHDKLGGALLTKHPLPPSTPTPHKSNTSRLPSVFRPLAGLWFLTFDFGGVGQPPNEFTRSAGQQFKKFILQHSLLA